MQLLLVGLEGELRDSIKSAFEEGDYVVTPTADREKVLELASTVQLIVIDPDDVSVDMGDRLVEHLRDKECCTPILMLTRKSRWTEKVASFDAGVSDFISKPFTMEELMARAKALVRRGH